jgi:DNA-binding NarL/FixJ family response regulator
LIKLILADDHPVFVSGLRAVFDAEEDMIVMSVATTGQEAVRAAIEHQPDVAVLDLNMPDGDGLWVCGQLRTAGLATRALILTMYDDDENVLAGCALGRTATPSRDQGRTRSSRRSARSLAVRRCSAPESRLKCSATSAGPLQHRHFRSSPTASTRCSACLPPAATTPQSPVASE